MGNGWTQTMPEQQILDCNTRGFRVSRWIAETAQLQVQLRRDLREGWRGTVVTEELMGGRVIS